MKYLIVILGVIALTGCGAADRAATKWTGKPSTVCYKGVEYIQMTSGASVAYNPDGTVRTCKQEHLPAARRNR